MNQNLRKYTFALLLSCGYCFGHSSSAFAETKDLPTIFSQAIQNISQTATTQNTNLPHLDLNTDTLFVTPNTSHINVVSKQDILRAEDIYDLHVMMAYLTARNIVEARNGSKEITVPANKVDEKEVILGSIAIAGIIASGKDTYDQNQDNLNSLHKVDPIEKPHHQKTEHITVPLKEHEYQIDKITMNLLDRAGICTTHYKKVMENLYFNEEMDDIKNVISWQRLENIDRNLQLKTSCDEGFEQLNTDFLKARKNLSDLENKQN